jgi:hypothetical protein
MSNNIRLKRSEIPSWNGSGYIAEMNELNKIRLYTDQDSEHQTCSIYLEKTKNNELIVRKKLSILEYAEWEHGLRESNHWYCKVKSKFKGDKFPKLICYDIGDMLDILEQKTYMVMTKLDIPNEIRLMISESHERQYNHLTDRLEWLEERQPKYIDEIREEWINSELIQLELIRVKRQIAQFFYKDQKIV